VRGGLAISGIYDLEPIRHCYLNDKLGLDPGEARRNSPMLHAAQPRVPLVITYGEDELPELCRQSQAYAAARSSVGLPGRLVPLAGHNHFTILEELADPGGRLTALLLELTAG